MKSIPTLLHEMDLVATMFRDTHQQDKFRATDTTGPIRQKYDALIEELEVVLEHLGAENPSQARFAFCRLNRLPRGEEPKYCAIQKCTRSVPFSMFIRGCSYCAAHGVGLYHRREQ